MPSEFRKGYGLRLLDFAVKRMVKHTKPFLTVLNVNKGAISLYERYGFYYSGEEKVLSQEKRINELRYIY